MTALLRLARGSGRDDSKNLCTNPSVETNTTGWSAISTNTIERYNLEQKFGDWSLRGNYKGTSESLFEYSFEPDYFSTFEVSAWVYVPSSWSGTQIRMQIANFGSASGTLTADANMSLTDQWQELRLTFTMSVLDTAGDIRFLDSGAAEPDVDDYILVDGLHIEDLVTADYDFVRPAFEQRGASTLYVDGDQEHCFWLGTAHASESIRLGADRNYLNLLNTRGIHLNHIEISVPPHKGGGEFSEGVLSDFRKLTALVHDNVRETYSLVVRGSSQTEVGRRIAELRRWCVDSTNFWTQTWNSDPVWIEQKTLKETNPRYALLMYAELTGESNYWSQPFLQETGALQVELELVVERSPWLSKPPWEFDDLLTAAYYRWSRREEDVPEFSYTCLIDDTWNCDDDAGTCQLDNQIILGDWNGIVEPGWGYFRFDAPQMPNGAVVKVAWIDFYSVTTYATSTVRLRIAGDTTGAATPTGLPNAVYNDLSTRATTSNFVDWTITATWNSGDTKETPPITDIIQELLDADDYSFADPIGIFVFDNGSDDNIRRVVQGTGGGVGASPPDLRIRYTLNRAFGEGDDEGNPVYHATGSHVVNRFTTSNFTHIYFNDVSAGTFSVNLADASGLIELWPDTVQAGDFMYFGIDETMTDDTQFWNVIMDIVTPCWYSGAGTASWEKRNAGWVALTPNDETDAGSGPASRKGLNGAFWEGTGTYMTSTTVNGVNAYWARIKFLTADTFSAVEVQEPPYTAVTNYLEVPSSELVGDFPTAIRMEIDGVGGESGGGNSFRRVVMGSRGVDRGEDFRSHINIVQDSKEINHKGISISTTTGATFTASKGPGNQHLAMTANGTHQERFVITIDDGLAEHYLGRFHAFFRVQLDIAGAAEDLEMSLRHQTGSGAPEIQTLRGTAAFSGGGELPHVLVDLGIVEFKKTTPVVDSITIKVHAHALYTWECWDFILIPYDEWSFDTFETTETSTNRVYGDRKLLIDSISYPRNTFYGVVDRGKGALDLATSSFTAAATQAPSLLQDKTHRLYFLFAGVPDALSNTYSDFRNSARVTMKKINRYQTLRGEI